MIRRRLHLDNVSLATASASLFYKVCLKVRRYGPHIIVFAFLYSSFSIAQADALKTPVWTHLELGAANYADEIVDNEDPGFVGPRADTQLRILFNTADELVRTRGPNGVLYLNDFDLKSTRLAGIELQTYLNRKGFTNVRIVKVPGDYLEIKFPRVQSAHLKNPDTIIFLKGDLSHRLQSIADQSATGLEITTHFESVLRGRFAGHRVPLSSRLGNGDIYIYPTGKRAQNDSKIGGDVIPGRYWLRPKPVSSLRRMCRAFRAVLSAF